jgi:outer membrane protein assembly factor BamB
MMKLRLVSCACVLLLATAAVAGDASDIFKATGVKGGLVVHVGCGDGKLTAALRAHDGYLVHGLDADPKNVEAARAHIRKLGLYGKVTVELWRGKQLPYVDNLVNLLLVEDVDVAQDEVLRVLAPNGVAYVKKDGAWTKTVKPRPKEIDDWTHCLYDASNNAVAKDTVVGPPRRLQWVGSPRWTRHHDRRSSLTALVSAGGRLFYIMDEGSTASILWPAKPTLIARDAFSGVVLWKRKLDSWFPHLFPFKSGPAQTQRRLVAVGDRVYVTLGMPAPLSVLDAATGKTIRTYNETTATEEVIAHDGLLFLVVNPNAKARVFKPKHRVAARERDRANAAWGWRGGDRQITAVEADSGVVLWKKTAPVVTLAFAADARGVYFYDGARVRCLDRKTGGQTWQSKPVGHRKPVRVGYGPNLVLHKDVVLFAGGDRKMTGLSAVTGKTLWTGKHHRGGHHSGEDLLVVDGLAWSGAIAGGRDSGVFTGLDPKTGVKKREFKPKVKTYWFHHRCYRARATGKYILPARTGTEFVDVRKKEWEIHHWVRGACAYGIMPCNGLLYAPPHPCACYPEAKLNGFNALAPAPRTPLAKSTAPRLEKGPAYGQTRNPKRETRNSTDWPTYRQNAARTGFTKSDVPANLAAGWQTTIGGVLSAPVLADGKLFVVQTDTHTVHALSAKDGTRAWSVTAGGRVDSPPTIWQGRVLFGAADGWVYCLRATDGALAWRFRVAPADRRLVAFEQVESVWPVPGNVLIQNDVAYCVAGRSMFLDGGLRLVRLDPATGKLLSETVMDERDPKTGKNLQARAQTLNMPVGLPDVLSSDGKHVYMRSQVFDMNGKRGPLGPHSGSPAGQGSVQQGDTAHLFSPSGFVDGSWFHRAYWVYGRSFAGGHGGYYQAGRYTPSGRILCVDDKRVFGYGRQSQYYKWTVPLTHHLFAASKVPQGTAPKPAPAGGSRIAVEISTSLNPAKKALTVEAWVKADKPDGVVLARGGALHGYALSLKAGRPQFAVRADKELAVAAAKEPIGKDWTHLAGVLTKDKQLRLYVNGKLAGSAKAKALIPQDPNDAMEIGIDDNSAVGPYTDAVGFTGLIDEVRIYRGAVGEADVRKHAEGAAPKADKAKLVLHYTFDKGDARDSSGNKNTGATGIVAVDGKVGKAMQFTGARSKKTGPRGRKRRGPMQRVKHEWSVAVPLHARAMVLANKTLFIAGPPAFIDEEKAFDTATDAAMQKKLAEQDAAWRGVQGALLQAVSTADGKKLSELKLTAVPVWDGLIAANGRLYLTTVDGKVHCFKGK